MLLWKFFLHAFPPFLRMYLFAVTSMTTWGTLFSLSEEGDVGRSLLQLGTSALLSFALSCALKWRQAAVSPACC